MTKKLLSVVVGFFVVFAALTFFQFDTVLALKLSFGVVLALWAFAALMRDVLEDCGSWNADALYQEGRTAFVESMRITDNPHRGIDGELWCEGWLDEKEAQVRRKGGQFGNHAKAVSCQ